MEAHPEGKGRMLRLLNPREAFIVSALFGWGWTQARIGSELGLGQPQVSRILADVLQRLGEAKLAAEDIEFLREFDK